MNSSTKLVLLTTLLTVTIGFAAASPADITLFPQESSARIDSYTSYEVTIENSGPVEDVYTLSSSNPSSITIAPKKVRIGADESKVVNLWYNPETQKEAGRYSFNINARSRATSNTYSAKGFVNVIREHDVALQAREPGSVCLGETATYRVKVTNEGLTKETFELSADIGEFSQSEVTLEDGESKVVEFYLSSEEPREANVNVVAASTTSYAQDIVPVSFKAETCYDSQVSISPGSQRVPAGSKAEYQVTVRNTGTKADQFNLQTNKGTIDQSSLQIGPGNSTTTTVTFTPEQLGQQTLEITAESEVTTKASATATVYNGMESKVTVPQQTVKTCENTEASTPVTVENTGEVDETFTLQASKGNLSSQEVTLGAGQSKAVNLSYNTGEKAQKVDYSVTSKASTFGKPTSTVKGKFNVQNCWDLKMSIIPDVASAGENRSQVYEIRLKNTGTRENTYELTYEGPSWIDIRDRENDNNERTVTVPAGETGYADIYAGIPFQKKGEVQITATAVGEQVQKSKTVKLVIGKDIEDAMKSDKGGQGSLMTGSFSDAVTGFIRQVQGQGTLAKAAIAVIVGLILTVAILYWEW